MKRFWYVLVTISVLSGGASWAYADTNLNRLGPYVGLGASAGLSDFNEGIRGYGDSAGFNALAGYRWHEYFALEGLYEYMDNFGRTDRISGVGFDEKVSTDIRTHNFSLMGKVILPILGPMQPYIKGGIGFLHVDVDRELKSLHRTRDLRGGSGTELSGRIDGGVDFFVTPELALTFDAGYVMPTEDLFPLNYVSLSLGARYHF